jgi:ATP synthase protein I
MRHVVADDRGTERRDQSPSVARRRRELGVQMAALGLEFSGSVIGGLILGYYLDKWFNSAPWLLLLGTFGGMAAAVARLIQLTRRFDQIRAENEPPDGG